AHAGTRPAARCPEARRQRHRGRLPEPRRPGRDARRAHHHRREDGRAALMHAASGPLSLIEGLPVAAAMRQWLWLYPAVEIVHILGFVLLAGSIALFDVRLLGFSRSLA